MRPRTLRSGKLVHRVAAPDDSARHNLGKKSAEPERTIARQPNPFQDNLSIVRGELRAGVVFDIGNFQYRFAHLQPGAHGQIRVREIEISEDGVARMMADTGDLLKQ